MTAQKQPLRRIRLVYRRSSTLLKCVVLTAVILCTICLIVLRVSILDERAKAEALRKQAIALEQENQQLDEYISDLGTVDSVKRIALELLGLVSPDTIIFLPNDSIQE